jgi:hypothetical protein
MGSLHLGGNFQPPASGFLVKAEMKQLFKRLALLIFSLPGEFQYLADKFSGYRGIT